MRFWLFLRLDAAGVIAYCSVWALVGYVFGSFIRDMAEWIGRASHAVLSVVLLPVTGYVMTMLVFYAACAPVSRN
jgi:membrane protein DedA with SNARE-associated domain